MFPIRDHNPSGRTPFVTYALIVANVWVFLLNTPIMGDNMALASFYADWALTPERVSHGASLHTILTSMFLHGSLMHLLGNMLFLWIFGDNLEDIFGHARFVLFYLLSGVAAAGLQVFADPFSQVPMIGASGAIAGVMGGYLLLFPRARVDILLIIVVFFRIFSVPAWVMLGLWFGFQVLNGLATDTDMGGIAYWAHAGGFVAGMIMAVPAWLRRGGTAFWTRTHGAPPHPQANYRIGKSSIPVIRRRK
jgi:membrane associated rhomboid family serine protease